MTDLIAALPMYDWPEVRTETDAQWATIRAAFRDAGIEAPDHLTRDQPDLHALWRSPNLIFAQTCWGPMGQGLADHVRLIGQPDYSDVEGGEGELYRSAILARRGEVTAMTNLEPDRFDGLRLAYNSTDSMSGFLALEEDIGSLDMFSERSETGSHRASIIAVAEGRADFCAIDCRTWALAQHFEPAAASLEPVGWTMPRKGLPFITSRQTSPETVERMRLALQGAGIIVDA